MDFLKEILGEELYSQFAEKINAYNGNEENKDKQIKLGNLASGEYVGKGKFDSLQALFDGQKTELETANNLIADFKKNTKGNEELQNKIADYNTQVAKLQAELLETKINSALKVSLLAESCDDIDYVSWKIRENLKEQGKILELDESENIKNWNDLLSGVKTQLPAHFSSGTNGRKVLDGGKLPDGDNQNNGITKAEFFRKSYAERAKFARTNPEAYASIMNK